MTTTVDIAKTNLNVVSAPGDVSAAKMLLGAVSAPANVSAAKIMMYLITRPIPIPRRVSVRATMI